LHAHFPPIAADEHVWSYHWCGHYKARALISVNRAGGHYYRSLHHFSRRRAGMDGSSR
jgi:hypothetical protein